MIRRAPRGIPAALILAGGISRHGQHCPCCYCSAERTAGPGERQAIPVIAIEPVRS